MKKLTWLLIGLALIPTASFAQLTRGQIAFGGTQSEQAFSIVQTRDGGYATAGYTQSFLFPGSTQSVYVVRFDAKGEVKWSKVIGGSGIDQAYSIVQSRDGGFAVTGYTNSFARGTEEVWVIKLDSNGTLKWSESIGGSAADQGKCIIQTRDGGYAIGGYSTSFGSGGPGDFYVIKIDSNGVGQWTETIGGGGDDGVPYTIIQSKDGGYALAGYTLSYGAGNADVYVVKLDSAGNLKWTRTVGGPLGDAGYSICETYDKGYAITGYEAETTFGAGSDDVYLIKLDSLGNLLWTKTLGGTKNDQGWSIIQSKDSGLVIAGFTASFGAGSQDIYLAKTNASGTLLWDRAVGGLPTDYGYCVVQTHDGGYAVGGYTDTYGQGSYDIFIVKFDSNGNTCGASEAAGSIDGTVVTAGSGGNVIIGVNICYKDSGRFMEGGIIDTVCIVLKKNTVGISTISADLSEMKLYPNPCTNTLNIDFGNQPELTDNKVNMEILDITGRVL